MRTVQYFEMNGQRAIWQDGWKAVTHHEPMLSLELMLTGDAGKVTDFEADRWGALPRRRGWNEPPRPAEQEPERLAAMVERWWVEAEKYDVLPLGAAIGGMNGPPITGRYRQAPPPEGL